MRRERRSHEAKKPNMESGVTIAQRLAHFFAEPEMWTYSPFNFLSLCREFGVNLLIISKLILI